MEKIKYIRQGDKGKLPTFAWKINNTCQYRCSYCFVDLEGEEDPQLSSIKKLVMLKLKKIDEPFSMELLGGEPTLHPDYKDIVEEFIGFNNVKLLNIITNLKKDMSFWEDHIKHPKLVIQPSIHMEYLDKALEEKLIYLNNNYTLMCNLMIHYDEKYNEKLKWILGVLSDLNIQYEISYLYDINNNKEVMEYPTSIKEIVANRDKPQASLKFFDEDKEYNYTVDEVYNNNLHHFLGWKCNTKYYTIDHKGYINRVCDVNSTQHIVLFKGISKIPLTCAQKSGCICDEYLEWEKWKDD